MSIMQMFRTESEDEPLYWITKNGADLDASDIKYVQETAARFYEDKDAYQSDLFHFLAQEGYDIEEIEADFEVEW